MREATKGNNGVLLGGVFFGAWELVVGALLEAEYHYC